jgi:hypothetical protein
VTDEDVYLFFKRYNALQDGMLTFEDYRAALLPLFQQPLVEDLILNNQE